MLPVTTDPAIFLSGCAFVMVGVLIVGFYAAKMLSSRWRRGA